jgi:ABC-type bacteriocin/lantibiotic exporter with double-glycine peptidase domain
VPSLQHHRGVVKKLLAWKMGARFVTEKGVILQTGTNGCGPASLKMILAAHGIHRSIADLTVDLRLAPEGTSMLELRKTSCKLGLGAKSWAVNPEQLNRVPLPAIAFVNGGHFVVVRRFITPKILEVDDPALGRLQWPTNRFAKRWSGEMLIFDPDWAPP